MPRPDRRERRRAAAERAEHPWSEAAAPPLGHGRTSTVLHEERLRAVVEQLVDGGARSVIDLGCGSGSLLLRLMLDPRFTRLVGVDSSAGALREAEGLLAGLPGADGERLSLEHASLTDMDPPAERFDAATLVETIEHIEPTRLSSVERLVFEKLAPSLVVLTTPNHDYNPLYGFAEGEYRHPDHRFEWAGPRFRKWADGVADRHGYRTAFVDVGPVHARLGSPSQMAVFRREDVAARRPGEERAAASSPSPATPQPK